MRKLSTFVDCLLITAVAVAAPTANEDFVVAEDAKTYTNAVNAANAYTDGKIAEIPAPDFSTNNTELVETIEAKAPTPDLSPFLRKDLGQSGFQEFGGFLSGMGFHVTHEVSNFNGWNNYTAKNGPTQPMQSLPSYIESNPWGFLKLDGDNVLTVPTLTVGARAHGTIGERSVAEGFEVTASGTTSHAEGDSTSALSNSAHAEGLLSTAWGPNSHAEGYDTQTQNNSEHAQGQCNLSHTGANTADQTISSIGIGGGNRDRKNAVETMKDGKTFIYGLGGYDGTNPTNGVKDLVAAIESKADAADIPEWAKAPTKPTYTASEVGAYSTNETMYVDWIGDIGCIYGDYMPSGVWDFGDGCIRIASWYQLNLHMTPSRQADGIEIFDTADPAIKTVIPINGSDVATIADIPDVPASISNIVTAAYINDRVNVMPLAGRTYDFATNIGLYTAVRDLIQALGGSVTNFPAIPQN